jgi:hypothetical protein
MSTAATVPAINLPKKPQPCSVIPKIPPITIPTPFGVDIKSMVDPSKGPPSDCAIVHSLMLQLSPMLAGFSCILKMLNVMASLEKFAKSPLTEAGDLIGALGKASSCLGLVNPAPWIGMIKAILQMILAYIGCLIQGIESIEHFKAGVDLNAEGGTPLLLNTLSCAGGNGDTSLAALMSSMEPIQPLLQMIDLIGEVIGLPLGLPSLNISASSGGSDPIQPIIDFHDKLQEVVDALPG